MMASDTRNPKAREKVELKPGFHLMVSYVFFTLLFPLRITKHKASYFYEQDWVRLNSSMPRGTPNRRITSAELKLHKTRSDCWTVLDGKVYNITQYLAYHPGGEKILMSAAGKDCTTTFSKYHRWVNGHAMLSNCIVGTYALADPEAAISEEGVEDDVEHTSNNKGTDESKLDNSNILLSKDQLLSEAVAKLALDGDDDD